MVPDSWRLYLLIISFLCFTGPPAYYVWAFYRRERCMRDPKRERPENSADLIPTVGMLELANELERMTKALPFNQRERRILIQSVDRLRRPELMRGSRSFTQDLLCALWGRVYRRFLYDDIKKDYDIVVRVKGWRTALVHTCRGDRRTTTPIFLWFK